MKKGWTTTKLIVAGGLAALRLVLSIGGGIIASATGFPATAGVINFLILGVFMVLTCRILPLFGSATLMSTIFAILAVPLPVGGGPAGFLPKILIGLTVGLSADLLNLYFRRKPILGALLIGGIPNMMIAFLIVYIGLLFGAQGIEETIKRFSLLTFGPLALVSGSIAGYIGQLIYKKVEMTSVVKRIQQ
ncbi:hypothetical protein A2165_00975 [Candidatus Curtissbacteria bacterium RBG_13_40_7]|uniref:ECF transporter S component n=1 Tax=Candidatus Curtissbacteria bacterium RBG_13_40_7 TaxID=1797706 RepID=A0A1F5FUR0_9BACT|nr:MAG: hypothetical protein A2165_00975 [Candidatus Curtissbacteria bacterium RBG_13_40_7]